MSGTERQDGWQYFITLTAPSHRRRHRDKRGGDDWCRCTPVGGIHIARWNAGHSSRWNLTRTRWRQRYPDIEFMRGIEPQDGKRRDDGVGRMALHDHVMVWSPRPLSEDVLREIAIDSGFGCEFEMVHCPPGSKRAAYYVAKYVTKAADSRQRVPWWGEVVDMKTGEVTDGLVDARYRTWSCSRRWGLTMAAVKRECQEYARTKAAETAAAQAADAVALLVRELGAQLLPDEIPPSLRL